MATGNIAQLGATGATESDILQQSLNIVQQMSPRTGLGFSVEATYLILGLQCEASYLMLRARAGCLPACAVLVNRGPLSPCDFVCFLSLLCVCVCVSVLCAQEQRRQHQGCAEHGDTKRHAHRHHGLHHSRPLFAPPIPPDVARV